MQKLVLAALSTLVGFGLPHQAKADYVPTSTLWTQITSTAAGSTSNGTQDYHAGDNLTETRTWNWDGNGQAPACTIALDFDVSLGTVYHYPPSNGYSASIAYGGFNSAYNTGNNAANFEQSNSVVSLGPPGQAARTLTAHVATGKTGAQSVYDTAYVYTVTTTYTNSTTDASFANSATSKLTGFSLSH